MHRFFERLRSAIRICVYTLRTRLFIMYSPHWKFTIFGRYMACKTSRVSKKYQKRILNIRIRIQRATTRQYKEWLVLNLFEELNRFFSKRIYTKKIGAQFTLVHRWTSNYPKTLYLQLFNCKIYSVNRANNKLLFKVTESTERSVNFE